MLRNPIGGVLFLLTLYFSSFFGSIFIMGPSLPLLLWHPKWFRWYNDLAIGLWLKLPPAILELVFNVKVYITGERPPRNDRALIVMNHRCRLDWMFYWCVLHRYGQLRHEKIILKDDLKNVPGPGWAMQNSMYIFLRRRWEHDQGYLSSVLQYFKEASYPLQLLIFPEGTNLDIASKAKSDSFAKKNNRPSYEYVLHPRVRGFTFCMEKLGKELLHSIHDVTIGYDVNKSFSERDLLLGTFPKEMHFHIQRHPIGNVNPSNAEEMEKWCCERWEEKENRLKEFYTLGQGFRHFNEKVTAQDSQREGEARTELWQALVFWVAFIFLSFLSVYHILAIRWYFYVVFVFYILQSVLGIGTDKLQLWSHDRQYPRHK
ncbi:lysocardiolipin acyltransferase 1 [Nematostella vectensis]|uniref:lysocardiolipin acyltransferase 1 n=1 Tax=Nematostella vectensis TaxID=45351 RepID=UPI0020777B03|nr:lysocardiolipin acyltransferase 1 [Nematostella vectensis]